MTPEQRRAARELAAGGGYCTPRVVLDLCKQIDADEWLMRRAMNVLYLEVPRTKIGAHRQESILAVLRTRLGDPVPEDKP